MPTFVATNPPHIHSGESVAGYYWKIVLALIPAILASVVFFPIEALRTLGCSVSGAILAEILSKHLQKKRVRLDDGATILNGFLFALMCPAGISPAAAALGGFVSIAIGKEIFGGTGQYLFHPALVGQAFIHASFSNSLQTLTIQDPRMLGELFLPGLVAGGIFLILKRVLYWEIPALFLFTAFGISAIIGFSGSMTHLIARLIWAAFFLFVDPTAQPMSRSGLRVFASGSACLLIFLDRAVDYFYLIPFSFLLMNALTPWIEARFKPGHVSKEAAL